MMNSLKPSLEKDKEMVRQSGLFDEAYYLNTYKDIREKVKDPLEHYLLHGGFEGRDASPEFSASYYIEQYTDVESSGMNPLIHYLKIGLQENRQCIPTFNLPGSNHKIPIDLNEIQQEIKNGELRKAREKLTRILKEYPESLRVRELIAWLCDKEKQNQEQDPWKAYWDTRKNHVYLFVCRQLIEIIGASANSVLDIGSNRTPILDWLPVSDIKFSVDPTTPYTGKGVNAVTEDYLRWKAPHKFNLGICFQVMEHLEEPDKFARKILEDCEVCIISVPYNEEPGVNPGHIQHTIDENTLSKWFGRKANFSYIAKELSGDERIIQVYDTKTEKEFPFMHRVSIFAYRFKYRWSIQGSGFEK